MLNTNPYFVSAVTPEGSEYSFEVYARDAQTALKSVEFGFRVKYVVIPSHRFN